MRKEADNQEQEQPVKPPREPYVRPVIEQFPPMHDVTFGTNVNPTTATVVVP